MGAVKHALDIQQVDIDQLSQHPDNANSGDVQAIAESIKVHTAALRAGVMGDRIPVWPVLLTQTSPETDASRCASPMRKRQSSTG